MRFKILKCPQCVLRCSPAEVFRKSLPVALQWKARQDDEAVQRPPERLGRHDEADGQDPQGDPVVAPPEADLDDRVPRVLVDRCVVHDDQDVATCSRGVQCSLLVEELLHERRAREPVEQEPVVPVLADDGDVVGLGPPAAADDEVGPARIRKVRGFPEQVGAHVALPSFPGSRDHQHHGSPLVQGLQVASPSREHSVSLFDTPVYVSLP